MKMNKVMGVFSGICGLSGIALGALGAHALKGILNPSQMESFKTAVLYQLLHAIVLLFISQFPQHRLIRWSSYFFIVGIILFSGSIYGLVLGSPMGVSLWYLGPLTPIGGLFMMAGWLSIVFHFMFLKNE
jgi:uncharacterized membrane protein YgdD (TMEM256/DUF423 family)